MSEKKLIMRGIYLGYLNLLVGLILSFVLTPIILRYIGQSAYGLWAVFGSVVGYFSLLNFGMNTATTKYTAEYCARNEQEILNKFLSTILVAFILIAVFIILVSIGLTPFIPHLFHLTEDLVSVGQIVFFIMGLNVALGFIVAFFSNIIYGYQRVDVLKTFAMIQAIANALFTIIFLRLGFGLIGVIVAFFASLLISMVLLLIFIHCSNYRIVIHPRLADVKILKNVAPYSIRNFILGLTAQIVYYTDNIVIGIFLVVSLVTPYSIAYKLCSTVATACFMVLDTFFPRFTRLYAIEDIDGLRSLYLKISKITIAILTPIVLFLAIFGHSFIKLWVGEQNFVGMEVFLILVFMNFLHSFTGPAGSLLQAIGKNKGHMYTEIINAGLNLLISIILVRKIGLLGVALGTFVAHLCTSTWVGPLLACKYTKLSLKTFLISGILPPLLAGIPAGIIIWMFILNLFPNNNFFYLGLKGVLVVLIYIVIYLAFAATREERQMYRRFFPRIVPRIG